MNNRGRGWYHDRLLTEAWWPHSGTQRRASVHILEQPSQAEGSSCRPARRSAGHGLCVMGNPAWAPSAESSRLGWGH